MPWFKVDGHVVHVKMAKPRVKSCRAILDGKICRAKPADRLCDGCDVQLCSDCRVTVHSRGRERDFCAVCFEPVFRSWLKALGNVPRLRGLRRLMFRDWAQRNAEFFDVIPLSKATLAEEAT